MGGTKFRHNRVTLQINFAGSAEGTTILGGPKGMSRKNFENLHLKIRIFLLRDLLAGETENLTFVVRGS